jgi:hypothetical protein
VIETHHTGINVFYVWWNQIAFSGSARFDENKEGSIGLSRLWSDGDFCIQQEKQKRLTVITFGIAERQRTVDRAGIRLTHSRFLSQDCRSGRAMSSSIESLGVLKDQGSA